ncbi:MAG: hypothetical protein OXR82_19895 [Gammaproteobacteria bacterium]|nr:hypothetical protein [Gammaproteobacteria bacterium]MDE0260636.1 hypothetical protein [Gammaproteobacteria bacterium]
MKANPMIRSLAVLLALLASSCLCGDPADPAGIDLDQPPSPTAISSR